MKEGKHTISSDQFKNKFMLVQDFKSQEEVISAIHGSGSKTSNPVASAMELAASGIRTATSTFDAVLPFMHLAPLIGQNPTVWAKASLFHYKSFFQPGDVHIQSIQLDIKKPELQSVLLKRIKCSGP